MPSVHPVASLLAQYHSGQSDPVYAVESSAFADCIRSVPVETFRDAAHNLRRPPPPDDGGTHEALALLLSHPRPHLAQGWIDCALFTAQDEEGESPVYEHLTFPPKTMRALLAELDALIAEPGAAAELHAFADDYTAGMCIWYDTRGHGSGFGDEDGEAAHRLEARYSGRHREDLSVYENVIHLY